MKEGQPSQTAALVAFQRALADVGITTAPEFHDPAARALLPPRWARIFDKLSAKAKSTPKSLLIEFTKRGVDFMVLRTLLIDAYLKEEVARGARQLVILGAGLDGRAHRIEELRGLDVFEVDHPATQAYKKEHAASLPIKAKSLRYVAVDFEQDSLADSLAAHGYQTTSPTLWLWEGVVMYLTKEAIQKTLRSIAAQSARGSGLIVNYHLPNQWPHVRNLLLRFWGEVQHSEHSPEDIAAELRAVGMRVVSDASIQESAGRFGTEVPRFGAARRSRIVLARLV